MDTDGSNRPVEKVVCNIEQLVTFICLTSVILYVRQIYFGRLH